MTGRNPRWQGLGTALLCAVMALAPLAAAAQEAPSVRPRPRPEAPAPAQPEPAPLPPETPAAPAPSVSPPAAPDRGPVTSLPLPRYVSLKGDKGYARRGPATSHRIDWVFTKPGMPLRITAEYENWRRVEDAEGMGGWVHFILLSGVRTALVTADSADFHSRADSSSEILFRAEAGVIGRILECQPDWCRLSVEGERGWTQKSALWGSEPGEVVE